MLKNTIHPGDFLKEELEERGVSQSTPTVGPRHAQGRGLGPGRRKPRTTPQEGFPCLLRVLQVHTVALYPHHYVRVHAFSQYATSRVSLILPRAGVQHLTSRREIFYGSPVVQGPLVPVNTLRTRAPLCAPPLPAPFAGAATASIILCPCRLRLCSHTTRGRMSTRHLHMGHGLGPGRTIHAPTLRLSPLTPSKVRGVAMQALAGVGTHARLPPRSACLLIFFQVS